MKFIFVCPGNQQIFESSDFCIIDYKGPRDDDQGRKELDAKVKLLKPCPLCGEKHVYQASELVCPFNSV